MISIYNFSACCLICVRNAALSLVCGNTQILKGADSTPLCTVAVARIIADVLKRNGVDGAVASMICGRFVKGDGDVQ